MKFTEVVEAAIKRLEKDGIFLTAVWSFSFKNSESDKKRLWEVADNVRTSSGKATLCPKDGYRLVFVGGEKDELEIEEYKYFAFIGDDDTCLFVRTYRDWQYPADGETVMISPKVPEYMLKKFATEAVPVLALASGEKA